ncbi:hypothetical protein [Fulvivirga sediminis]|uniref:Uncharacterized protein n=1 Tax=Fulvivirga sediminis TaxID=2803949 RepID=A0A937K0J4_9BACT|nr:hypothetical protein [Fulvivirga sediminis]MBL3658418.1 hypothetical protein [Fulvivirga sediminis]
MQDQTQESNQPKKEGLSYSAPEEVAGEPLFTGVKDMKAAGANRSIYARPADGSQVHTHFEHGQQGKPLEHEMNVKNPDVLNLVRCQTSANVAREAGEKSAAQKVVHANTDIFNSDTPLEYTTKDKAFHMIDMTKPIAKRSSNESLQSNSSSGHSQEVSPNVQITDKGKKLRVKP